jgi:uncharacterized membrane protein
VSGQQAGSSARLPFIDFARGIAMVLMAWDHASLFWNPGHQGSEGLMGMRPPFESMTQFLLRFVTHFAAPTFVFLAGTSLALSTGKRLARGQSQVGISLHLVIRGLLLLAFELAIITPAFELPLLYFGVLACIGLCLILFGALRFLPWPLILALSLAAILGQPFLTLRFIPAGPAAPLGHYLRVILFEPRWDLPPYVGLYPLIPWLGVMGLGWCFGVFLNTSERRYRRWLPSGLLLAGGALLAGWFVVRLLRGYGNLLPRRGGSLEGWLYMSKYPPSLAFLLFTLGGMCLMLALGAALQRRPGFDRGLTGVINTFGRVPLFFYLVHLWLYKLTPRPFTGLFDDGPLAAAIIWLTGLAILWALCSLYARAKARYPRSVLQYI